MKPKLYTTAVLFCLLLTTLTLWAAAPTTPASNVTFNIIDGGSMRVNWTSGNGARRLVIAKAGSPVTANPVNGTDYLSNPAFGSGHEIAPGEFIVAESTTSFSDISGLQPNTTYHFAVFEYNGTGSATEYHTTAATGNASTLTAPTVQASNVTFSNVIGNSMRVAWTNGNGNRRIVIMNQGSAVDVNPADLTNYNASSTFGSGTQIGSGNHVVYNGAGITNNVSVTNLAPGTTYHVAVFEANGNSTPVFLTTNPPLGNRTTEPRPTVAASSASTSIYDGATMRLSWTSGNGSRRIVVARAGSAVDAVPADGVDYLSGTSSPFNTAPEMAPGQKVIYDNAGNFMDITGLSPGTTYHFRIYEYDGTGSNIGYLTSAFASGSGTTVSAPTNPASALLFSNITATSMRLDWTAGNGNRRIVLAKANSPVDAVPADLVNYGPSSNFGSGTQIGSGNYVVYNSTGNNVTINNLAVNVTYHYAVFEANGNTTPVFLTTSPATGSQATSERPTTASSALQFPLLDGGSMRLSWTSGNGARRIVVARAGSAVDAIPADGVDYLGTGTSAFNTAPEISPGQKVVYDNSGNQFDLSGLTGGTTYHFRVYEYDGTGTSIKYLTASFASGSASTLSAPATPASNIIITNITGNSMQLTWTNGNGNRRIVLAKAGSPVDATPVDYTSYGSNSFFGSGSQIGSGNYVVFNGTGSTNTATVNNLSLNTTYHFAVFEANGNSTPVFLTSGAPVANATTVAQPTIPSSGLSFSVIDGTSMRLTWTPGNGTRRIVVARAGSAVDAVPADGVDYLSPSTAPFNSAPEIAPGQKVVGDNSSSQLDLLGLSPSTIYYFRIYEYGGTGSSIAYLTSSFASGSASTASDPTLQAAALSFTSVTSNSAIISWTNGNGTGRLVVLRQGSAVNSEPVDLTNYTSNNNFGVGGQVGSGNYVVLKGNTTNVTVNNLVAGTTYHAAVYEYNGSSAPMYLTPGITGQVTTIGPPATQASSASVANISGNSVDLRWVNGSGNRRIVLMKKGSAVDAVPANNINYFANSFFGSGDQIGTGNFVVFDGIQDFVTVTNLQSNSSYHFAVFEYNDFGATSQVLTTNPATGNFNTIILPVRLTVFRASAGPDDIKLIWSTDEEAGSDYFEIESAPDGVQFKPIARLASRGNLTVRADYHYTDRTPFRGSNYYRLKQVDKNGTYVYSTVIRIMFDAQRIIRKMVNPVSNRLALELYSQPSGQSSLVIYDAGGRVVRRERVVNTLISSDISALPRGNYILKISSGGIRERIKLVKQ
jgi:hypothetical protein